MMYALHTLDESLQAACKGLFDLMTDDRGLFTHGTGEKRSWPGRRAIVAAITLSRTPITLHDAVLNAEAIERTTGYQADYIVHVLGKCTTEDATECPWCATTLVGR